MKVRKVRVESDVTPKLTKTPDMFLTFVRFVAFVVNSELSVLKAGRWSRACHAGWPRIRSDREVTP